ncbi:MepB family protein [bacterium]|nr:MAG: MepB family protein [bacterium]QQR61828.1 MAG: MepB family protein [bacterium]QQR62590.1 MAG: MepB family protein [bacterium]
MNNQVSPENLLGAFEFLKIYFSSSSLENMIIDKEGGEYDACSFVINNRIILFRKAKKTPKKDGFFVAIWIRDLFTQKTRPFDASDIFDFFVIFASEDAHEQHLFIINKSELQTYAIVSTNFQGGKRGFRLYPPSTICMSFQAYRTQQWQKQFFVGF